jgi:ATP-dependent Zn protease
VQREVQNLLSLSGHPNNEMLSDEMQAAVSAISENRAKIDALVDALLEKNKLSREEMDGILKSGAYE